VADGVGLAGELTAVCVGVGVTVSAVGELSGLPFAATPIIQMATTATAMPMLIFGCRRTMLQKARQSSRFPPPRVMRASCQRL
jgi:hypothetical protein